MKVFIIILDAKDGERLYWSNYNGWVGDRDMAEEYEERPHTLPQGCDAKVFEYESD